MRASFTLKDWCKCKTLSDIEYLTRGFKSGESARAIVRLCSEEELAFILPRIKKDLAFTIFSHITSHSTLVYVSTLDLFPLEKKFDFDKFHRTAEDPFFLSCFKCGINLFEFPQRLEDQWALKMLDWTPERHKDLPARVKDGTIYLFMSLKRIGVKLNPDLRKRIIRQYVYGDYLYMKAVHFYINKQQHDVSAEWKILRETTDDMPVSSYSRGSIMDKIYCLSQTKSSYDLMYNTVFFGDTAYDDTHGSSNEMHIRNAYIMENYDAVIEYMGFKRDKTEHWAIIDLYVNLYRHKKWDVLVEACGYKNLCLKGIHAFLYKIVGWEKTLDSCDYVYYKFLVDLTIARNEWPLFSTKVHCSLFFCWSPYKELIQYAIERGAGWFIGGDTPSYNKWNDSWCQWTPTLHEDLTLFTLDFRYRVRPLLKGKYTLKCVAGRIIHWMAYAIWIEKKAVAPVFLKKDQMRNYLSRFIKKLPPRTALVVEHENRVKEISRWVKLYNA